MKIKAKELNSGYEGYTRVSRFSPKAKSKMIIAVAMVGVFIFVYVLSYFGVIPFGAVKAKLVSNITQDKENFPIYINTDSTIRTDTIGDSIIVLTTNNFSVYSPRGTLTYSESHNYGSPALSVNGDKAVVFDRGDKGYMLINEKKVVFSGNADENIICAEYGESGNYALGTEGTQSTSFLSVYSSTYKLVFGWSCDYEHITSIALSKDGKYAGVSVISAQNGEVFTTVNYFGFDYNRALNTQTIKGAASLGVAFTSFNTLNVYTDIGIYSVEKSSEEPKIIKEYYSSEFISYGVNSKGKSVVALAKYGSNNDINIIIYSSTGKEKKVISVEETIKSISVTDKYIFALAENAVMVYNLSGHQVNKINVEGDAHSIIATDYCIYIISLDKISRCFSYGDDTVELIV